MKALGHASNQAVARGLVRPEAEDKVGNDIADDLATRGAAAHALPKYITERLARQRGFAIDVHNMMVDILEARAKRDEQLTQNIRP